MATQEMATTHQAKRCPPKKKSWVVLVKPREPESRSHDEPEVRGDHGPIERMQFNAAAHEPLTTKIQTAWSTAKER